LADQPHAAQAPAIVVPVTLDTLVSLRHEVGAVARHAGFGDPQAYQFVTAVNEIVINAIEHGTPPIHVAISARHGTVTVDVRDEGPGLPREPAPDELPPSDQTHGRGLWIARRLCDELTFHASGAGATVRLRATARPQ